MPPPKVTSRAEHRLGKPSRVRTPAEFKAGEAEFKSRQRRAGERAGEAKARRELAEHRLAQAKAPKPPSQRDEAPATRGPKAAPRGPRAPRIGTKGLARSLRSFASRNPRRVLLAELLLVVVITITSRVSEGEVPRPSDLLAPFVVYLVLGFAAEVGGSTARLAAGIGGLVLLAVVMANAGGIARTISAATLGGPTTPGAQGISGFTPEGEGAGFGTAGGGGGGSF